MTIPGYTRCKRWLKRRQPGAAILMYHSIASPDTTIGRYKVSTTNLDGQLAALQLKFHIVSLRSIVERCTRHEPFERREVALTFDDGYADNLTHAKPILEKFHAPATIFITTGYIGAAKEFWWDELERLIMTPGELPERLEIQNDEWVFEFDLEEFSSYSPRRKRGSSLLKDILARIVHTQMAM